jgi:UDP-3-O-[3-hydroxymyristoyl] glucosamine N-acyltransferase
VSNPTHTAFSIAKEIQATIEGPGDLACTGIASLSGAREGDLTFMVNPKYAKRWSTSSATIGIVQRGVLVEGHDDSTRALLRVDNPELAMATCLELFKTHRDIPEVGIHPSAIIDPSATIGHGVRIGSGVVVGADAIVGDNVSLLPHVFIGHDVTIGSGSELRSGVSVEHDCVVGTNCILYANVSIGTDGFGYCPAADMSGLVKLEHIGNVVIGDNVEIGSNSCVDRGKFASTSIGNGTKIDNLVQIGHNVSIGENCVFASGTGLGGSVQIGNWVQIAAQVGIAPHCKVGNGAKIGAKSGVMNDIPAGEAWLGVPACKMKDMLRQWVTTRKMPKILAQFGKSEKQ